MMDLVITNPTSNFVHPAWTNFVREYGSLRIRGQIEYDEWASIRTTELYKFNAIMVSRLDASVLAFNNEKDLSWFLLRWA